MSYWIKTYTEILNDPKIGRLPLALRWRFVEACLLVGAITPANEIGNGYLPPLADAAFMAHASEEELERDWKQLESVGLLTETAGGWLVVNFAKRQAPSEVTERVRLHRERKQLLQKHYGNVSVTTADSDSDTDTESDIEEDRDEFTRVKTWIEKHVGLPAMPKDVPAIQELSQIPDLQESDIIGAIAWHKDQGRVVYGASHLLGSIKYNRAQRIQASAKPSKNGRGKSSDGIRRTGALDRARQEIAEEEARKHGRES